MNNNLWSNTEFTEIKKRLNQEIQRRGTFKWWDPLTTPSVGQDKSSPLSIPEIGDRFPVNEKTYTINNPSDGSIEKTKNVLYPDRGENPAGEDPSDETSVPNISAAKMSFDEMRNFLVGLSKIQDINLFYGRDEVEYTAFRDPNGIEEVLIAAEASELNKPLSESDLSPVKPDPNGNITDYRNPRYPENVNITYPMENGQYVMPSGESDGEEALEFEGLSEKNFYDDYGAKPGDGDFHPYNPFISPIVDRNWNDQGHDRKDEKTHITQGGVKSSSYGPNPRNPEMGNMYVSRPVKGGVRTSCNVACTGLCYQTCDNECSESCSTTCWNRCGNACTSSCGNLCTGCSTMCYSSCKTKCENTSGYSCLKAGARTVKIYTKGGHNGEYASNHIESTYYTCQGCSYTCQFYPNKKTTCWDADCMSKCFTSCTNSCSTSCYGGCIDNASENNGEFKSGKGRGCSGGCTINCVGECKGVCEGTCIHTCYSACKQTCSDNCAYQCSTHCGSGCEDTCINDCKDECKDKASSHACNNTCTGMCQNDCNSNCVGWGCRSICGIDNAGACDSNCRLSCMSSSCTSLCENACSSICSSCVNSCGWQCGPCVSECSNGCGAACNITCTATCEYSCETNCVHSCTEECGGCSNLCYSCVGMCIGVCSVKCENGCSTCSNMCSYWCDITCNRGCASDCSNVCINTCSGSCSTFLKSEPTKTPGPERDPIANGYIYPHPKNRWEERESFKIYTDILPYKKPVPEPTNPKVLITFNDKLNLEVICVDGLTWITYATTLIGGVWSVDSETGDISVNEDFLAAEIPESKPSLDGNRGIFVVRVYNNPDIPLLPEDVESKLPWGFETIGPLYNKDGDMVCIIQRHVTMLRDTDMERYLIPIDSEDVMKVVNGLKYALPTMSVTADDITIEPIPKDIIKDIANGNIVVESQDERRYATINGDLLSVIPISRVKAILKDYEKPTSTKPMDISEYEEI